MSEDHGGKILSIDSRKLRNLGNAFGFSIDKGALEDLGAVDENGDLAGEFDARQIVHDDGTVEFKLDLEADDRDAVDGARAGD